MYEVFTIIFLLLILHCIAVEEAGLYDADPLLLGTLALDVVHGWIL